MIIVAKQVADLITLGRAALAFFLVWLGAARGPAGLALAACLLIADWLGDSLDGRIARRSRVQYHTWIGDHDLEVDMAVSIGLLIFMIQSGLVNLWLAGAYLAAAGFYFWRQGGVPRSPGMLFQAPIYGWFIWVALHQAPEAGWAIIIFIAVAIALTWPYFPRVMVPGFLAGMRRPHNN